MTAITIFYLSQIDYWITPLAWIENMTDLEKDCEEALARFSTNSVGLK